MATMTEIAAAGGKPGKAAAFDAELEYVKKIRGPPEKAEPAFSEAYVVSAFECTLGFNACH